jgi:competence protein ComEC
VYNPHFLWDAGFLLSYTAVLGILVFMKPIYRCIYYSNQLLDAIWQLNAVTLSAQILTLPLVFYYFHQFPNYFLFTNFFAVPVSGLILYGEIVLLLISPFESLCKLVGSANYFLINQINGFIERTARLPNAITDNIHITIPETVLLYLVIIALAFYLLQQLKNGLFVALSALLLLTALKSFERINTLRQHKIIIYNIPKQSAIDIIEGNQCYFIGNIDTPKSKWASMYLRPARIERRVAPINRLKYTYFSSPIIAGAQKTVVLLNNWPIKAPPLEKIKVDLVIVNENAAENLSLIAATFNCSQYVFDSSIPLWKIEYLKKEAESLHLRHHFILEQGAFQVNI